MVRLFPSTLLCGQARASPPTCPGRPSRLCRAFGDERTGRTEEHGFEVQGARAPGPQLDNWTPTLDDSLRLNYSSEVLTHTLPLVLNRAGLQQAGAFSTNSAAASQAGHSCPAGTLRARMRF